MENQREIYVCETCGHEYLTKEELIQHYLENHVSTKISDNNNKIPEIQSYLDKKFYNYNTSVSKHKTDYEYNIKIYNHEFDIHQIFNYEKDTMCAKYVPLGIDSLINILHRKILIAKNIKNTLFERGYDVEKIFIDYENNHELSINIVFEIDGMTYTEQHYYYNDKFPLVSDDKIVNDIIEQFNKYETNELIGEWELEEPSYMNTPNLMINDISVIHLLDKAKKLNKKVKLSIVDEIIY